MAIKSCASAGEEPKKTNTKRDIKKTRSTMAHKKKLVVQVRELLYEKGREALDMARQSILQETVPFKPLQDALQFFIMGWEDVLHPALLSLACEAVGGKPSTTIQLGAALALL